MEIAELFIECRDSSTLETISSPNDFMYTLNR